jgi:hypothetical protein
MRLIHTSSALLDKHRLPGSCHHLEQLCHLSGCVGPGVFEGCTGDVHRLAFIVGGVLGSEVVRPAPATEPHDGRSRRTDSPTAADTRQWTKRAGGATKPVKFTPQGGRVEMRGQEDGDGILLWVQNSWPGIPLEDQGRIFDRFTQAG